MKFYDYIDKWFHFSSENVIVKLKPMDLYEELSFTDQEQEGAALKRTATVSMEQLYEEFCASQEEIQKPQNPPVRSRWQFSKTQGKPS